MTSAQRSASAAATRASVERDTEPGYMKDVRSDFPLTNTDFNAPRKLSPTERLHEVTMAAMTRPVAPPESSVSFTRNAKGVTQIEITVRAPAAIDAYDVARGIYEDARARYPLPSGYVGAEGEPAGGAK